jgi:nucleotide-binding universal stress UspA family protein
VPATEIDLLGRFTEADLIVVGRRGLGRAARLGSTVRALLDIVDRPVLVVGEGAKSNGYARAVVALDLRLVSADLLVLASRLVDERTTVEVLHAFESSFEGTRGLRGRELNRWGERFERSAQARLDEIMNALPESDISWRSETVLGDPAPAVTTAAKQRQADLVVVGTQRRRGLARLVSGSVALQVLEGVNCDCLVLSTPGQERAFPPRPSAERSAT